MNLGSVLILSGEIRGGSIFKRQGIHDLCISGRLGILAKYLIVIDDRHSLGNFLIYLKTPNTGPYRSGGGEIYGEHEGGWLV